MARRAAKATDAPSLEAWRQASVDKWVAAFEVVRAQYPDLPVSAQVAATDYAVKQYA